MGRFRKINGKTYVRTIIGYLYKKHAQERAKDYRFFGISARVIKEGKAWYVYVPKNSVKWINKKLVQELRI